MPRARGQAYDRIISRRSHRAAQIAFAALAALLLGGCGFLSALGGGAGGKSPVKRINVTTPYSASESVQPGTIFTPTGGGTFTVSNQIVKGTFTANLPFKVDPSIPKRKKKKASAAAGFRSVSGTFVSKLQGSYNAVTDTGTFNGVRLLRFAQGPLGDACLTWTSTTTANSETGSFSLAGGTKLAARARMTGTFNGTKTQTGLNATVTGSITVSGKVGKPARGLNADCQALVGQL